MNAEVYTMRIKTSKSKNSISYYVIKDITRNGKRTTKVVEALGNHEEILEKHPGVDPMEWAKEYAKQLTLEEKDKNKKISVQFNPKKKINAQEQNLFNVGYLFLQSIFNELNMDKLSKRIATQHQFKYDLGDILSRLIYTRILSPSSKKSTFDFAKTLLEQPNFELHHIYRSLEVLSEHSNEIQEEVYKQSKKMISRDTNILYYDCTNYFFEIEESDGLKQYGRSKENRPNPIVQMGLFMDGSGIPLAFDLTTGNTNEQTTLKPIERRIIKDFELSKFVVCTDAGLSSNANRKFNNIGQRAFITTQSVKKMKKFLKDWMFDTKGWKLSEGSKQYDINNIDEDTHYNRVFYKERWIKEDGLEQRLIITYSPKYRQYQASVRQGQIDRAVKKVENPSNLKKKNAHDVNRFISTTHITNDGEIADQASHIIDEEKIAAEAQYDGFYAVCTNLESDVGEIITINQKRWEIEESFRILKTEFKSRPVYVRKDTCIQAHFLTCFLALTFFRILEKKLDEQFTCSQITKTLRDMKVLKIGDEGFTPAYQRTEITDYLHKTFGFDTDYEIMSPKFIRNILKQSNNRK